MNITKEFLIKKANEIDIEYKSLSNTSPTLDSMTRKSYLVGKIETINEILNELNR
jgi:hypothetical protein